MTDAVSWDTDEYRRDDELRRAFGTSADDVFRWLHYHGGDESHYATDIDMAWVDANPRPHVAAFVEYKNANETVSFPQAVFFEAVAEAAPVFIVRSQEDILTTHPSRHQFCVERFTGIDRSAPQGWISTETVRESLSWGRRISGEGDLDPAWHSGLLAFEENHRRQTQQYQGRPLAALSPEDVTAYTALGGGSP